jgi:hypothetical protein
MLTPKRYHLTAAALPLALALFLAVGSLYSCSENPPTQGKDSCDTCHVPCDSCDTTKPSSNDTTSHDFIWTEYSIPEESNITGVWVFGQDSILLVGRYLYWFDGVNFTKRNPLIPPSRPISGALADYTLFAHTPDDYWLVHGSIAFHVEGNTVTEYRPGSVNACWGTSSNDMFFVGNKGNINHFDGTKFTKMASPTTKNLRSVWGTSHNDVWACGFNSSTAETILLHYDGTSWTEDEISVSKGIYATGGFNVVWACDSANHKFVTTSGAILIRKTDNNSWRSDSGLVPNGLGGGEFIGISPRGNTANDFMVIGGWGFTAHWNGKTWYKYNELFDYNNLNYGASGFHMKGNTACIVGDKNGSSWIAIGRRK